MKKIKSILLIDDDEISNFLCEETIKSYDLSSEVISFSNGFDALNYLVQNAARLPELIFLDINMPGMDGWEFLDSLHSLQQENAEATKVIILSSSNYKFDIQKSREYPEVIDYVAKPLTSNVLDPIFRRLQQNNLTKSTCS